MDFGISGIWRSEVLSIAKIQVFWDVTRYVLIFIDVSKDRGVFLFRVLSVLGLTVQINCRCLEEGVAGSLSSRVQKPAFANVMYLKRLRPQ